jgi:hypothetical protein
MAGAATLTNQHLNRALLARQMLLAREPLPPVQAIERLFGMQAQQARPPFVGLWTRVAGFERGALLELLRERSVVRATMWRGTLHLLTAEDYLTYRSSMQPALTASMRSILRERLKGVDVQAIAAAAEQGFEQRPQTFAELRATLSSTFPGLDERAMGFVARCLLPLVTVPDTPDYGFGAATVFATAKSWLGQAVPTGERIRDLVLRYLAAFGPATPGDAQNWSAIPNLKPVFEELRPDLLTFRDERKRELFDLPDAPRPPADAPAPVRFLPGFDNAILGHSDRTRIIADEHRPRVSTKNLQVLPTFLVNGFVAGTWDSAAGKKTATLTLAPFFPMRGKAKGEVVEEAERLVLFLGPGSFRVEWAG